MATNPMQRQARNSFILGMVITLIIAGVVVALLFMHIKKLNEEIEATKVATKKVYVLNQDIKSGQIITSDLFTQKEVRVEGVPADATGDINAMLSSYSLCDKAGNNIYTDKDGLYMLVDGTKNPVYQETTGSYYTKASNGQKTYIETTEKALIAKTDLKANTVIAGSLITRVDELKTDDVRTQEYNMLSVQTDILTGDYVDVRLQLPNGQDYIVVSKKMITVPMVGGEYLSNTVQMDLPEEDILIMSCAIVEAYQMEGSKLYVTKYVEAGLQEAATPTYVVNSNVAKLMENDANIVKVAKDALFARYNSSVSLRNEHINGALTKYGAENEEAVKEKMQESITSTQESRQEYLQSLAGGTAAEY